MSLEGSSSSPDIRRSLRIALQSAQASDQVPLTTQPGGKTSRISSNVSSIECLKHDGLKLISVRC